jgi:hypothetical protein
MLKFLNPFSWRCFQPKTLDDVISESIESYEFTILETEQQLLLIQYRLKHFKAQLAMLQSKNRSK